jgi:hypothetical protein
MTRAEELAMWKQNGRPNGTLTRVASKTMTKAVLRV